MRADKEAAVEVVVAAAATAGAMRTTTTAVNRAVEATMMTVGTPVALHVVITPITLPLSTEAL